MEQLTERTTNLSSTHTNPKDRLSKLPSELLARIFEFIITLHEDETPRRPEFEYWTETHGPSESRCCIRCLARSYRTDLRNLCLTSKYIKEEAQRILYRDVSMPILMQEPDYCLDCPDWYDCEPTSYEDLADTLIDNPNLAELVRGAALPWPWQLNKVPCDLVRRLEKRLGLPTRLNGITENILRDANFFPAYVPLLWLKMLPNLRWLQAPCACTCWEFSMPGEVMHGLGSGAPEIQLPEWLSTLWRQTKLPNLRRIEARWPWCCVLCSQTVAQACGTSMSSATTLALDVGYKSSEEYPNFDSILKLFRNLTDIRLHGMRLQMTHVQALLLAYPNLQSFRYVTADGQDWFGEIDDCSPSELLALLANHNPNLRYLVLDCAQHPPVDRGTLAQLTKLESLAISAHVLPLDGEFGLPPCLQRLHLLLAIRPMETGANPAWARLKNMNDENRVMHVADYILSRLKAGSWPRLKRMQLELFPGPWCKGVTSSDGKKRRRRARRRARKPARDRKRVTRIIQSFAEVGVSLSVFPFRSWARFRFSGRLPPALGRRWYGRREEISELGTLMR
ncbi:hypothetical protein QBC34DRAFT_401500 [Podospora aff. communis PSN243]|uniref:F-box domain-containing protein n=1 Tax=Podospora aff. communis PSN243 TaxID=3040156 RepID=A0AAV9GX95_9PEZI|nr:hypothetical protein QBC34DRAFT_401500 [Podospora aff. communis PSN243]